MDELKLERIRKCANNPEGHIFGKPINNITTCHMCEFTIEEVTK